MVSPIGSVRVRGQKCSVSDLPGNSQGLPLSSHQRKLYSDPVFLRTIATMNAGPTMLRVCADESLRWRIAARLVLVLAGTWSGSALAQSAPADTPRPCK